MFDAEVKRQEHHELEAAFEQFNVVSGELIDAYRRLEQQVGLLNAQLDQANQELRQQLVANAELAERLSMLLEALPAGVVELCADDQVITENPTAIQMLGQSCIGLDWSCVLAKLEETTLDQTFWTRHTKDGIDRQLTIQYKQLPATGRRIVLLHDVTRLNQLSVELARQQKLAAMGGMAAALAHQLRTPLSTAMLYAANLRQVGLTEGERGRFIDKVLARLGALESLIQNMLGFVRGHVLQLEPLDIESVIEELKAVILPQCTARSLTLGATVSLSSPAQVLGDRKALLGALTNLVENAVHFSAPGGVISIDVQSDRECLLIAVEDNGPGIDPAHFDRLFEPFFTTRSGGTGLGLAIVKKVTEELGGEIQCISRFGYGARFELRLPLLR